MKLYVGLAAAPFGGRLLRGEFFEGFRLLDDDLEEDRQGLGGVDGVLYR